jgi:hypothetical protein
VRVAKTAGTAHHRSGHRRSSRAAPAPLSATSPAIPDLPRSRRPARLAITAVLEITPISEKPGKTHKNPFSFSPNLPKISPNFLNPSSFLFSFLFFFPFSLFLSLSFSYFLFPFLPFSFFLPSFPFPFFFPRPGASAPAPRLCSRPGAGCDTRRRPLPLLAAWRSATRAYDATRRCRSPPRRPLMRLPRAVASAKQHHRRPLHVAACRCHSQPIPARQVSSNSATTILAANSAGRVHAGNLPKPPHPPLQAVRGPRARRRPGYRLPRGYKRTPLRSSPHPAPPQSNPSPS